MEETIQQTDKGNEETKIDEKKEDQMKKMETEFRPTDKEKQAHSNEAKEKIA